MSKKTSIEKKLGLKLTRRKQLSLQALINEQIMKNEALNFASRNIKLRLTATFFWGYVNIWKRFHLRSDGS